MTDYRPADTDERLRSRLDANQLDRERLCQAVLALDTRFRDVRPRHPRGGKDGGRDLEARLTDGRVVWAGIGFRNSVSDSVADRVWVRKKFLADLSRMLEENDKLQGFVFLTNVELTIKQREGLAAEARARGVVFVDVLHRERLRILLDSPDGLAARFQYLGIPLSPAEQATFFARWGNQLEALVTRQFALVDRQLARLEFMHACTRPLRVLGFDARLRDGVDPAALGHFRILLSVGQLDGRAPFVELKLGLRSLARASDRGAISDARPGKTLDATDWMHTSGGLWVVRRPSVVGQPSVEGLDDHERPSEVDPGEERPLGLCTSQSSLRTPLEWLSARGTISGWTREFLASPALGDFDEAWIALFVTAPLVDCLASLQVTANEYVLFEASLDGWSAYPGEAGQWDDLWPEPLEDSEARLPWVRLDAPYGGLTLDFSTATPRRLYAPDETPPR